MSWLIGGSLLAVGIVIGVLITKIASGSERTVRELTAENARLEAESASYRKEVAEHFRQTAAAVETMTESYVAVHRQLREGAQRLCNEPGGTEQLRFDPPGKVEIPLQVAAAELHRATAPERQLGSEIDPDEEVSTHVEPPRDYPVTH